MAVSNQQKSLSSNQSLVISNWQIEMEIGKSEVRKPHQQGSGARQSLESKLITITNSFAMRAKMC